MSLTTHLLVRNDSPTIERAIQSILPLNGRIIIGDIGSTDDTVRLCQPYSSVITTLFEDNYADAKNKILEQSGSEWILFIDPWEILATGHDVIRNIISTSPGSYHFQILQGGTITKETRLWHRSKNLRFANPVYETIHDKSSQPIDSAIYSRQTLDLDHQLKLVNEWQATSDPHYYRSCILLAQKKYKEFLASAAQYLFLERSGMSATMLKYYVAIVQLYEYKKYSQAIQDVLSCLAVNPLMAEFWCLLGDAYYSLKQYDKAYEFYDNAIIMGNRRLKSDLWPIEVSKYKEYPEKMMTSCNKINQETRTFTSNI